MERHCDSSVRFGKALSPIVSAGPLVRETLQGHVGLLSVLGWGKSFDMERIVVRYRL